MSRNFRRQTQEVREKGELERGTFVPTIEGTPYKMYKWWLERTRNPPTRENFCHYWRVIFIWSPLMRLASVLGRVFGNKVILSTVITVLAVLLVVLGYTFNFLSYVAVGAASVYIVLGLVMGVYRYQYEAGELMYSDEWLTRDHPTAYRALVIVFAPLVFFVWAIGAVFKSSKTLKYVGNALLGLILLACLGILTVIIVASIAHYGLVPFLVVVGTILLVIAVITAFSIGSVFVMEKYIEPAIKRRRRARRDAEDALRMKISYGKATAASSNKSVIGSILRTIGDFVILIVEVVRVNKWKICPIVELPEES